jgi:hypothetical protein
VALHFSLGVTPPSPSGPPHSLGPLCFAGPAGPAAGLRDRRRSRLCGSLCDSPDPSPSVPPFGRSGKRCSGQPLLGDPRVRLLPLVPGSPRLCPGTDGLRVPLQRLLLAPRVALNSPVQQGAKTPALPFHRLVEDPGGATARQDGSSEWSLRLPGNAWRLHCPSGLSTRLHDGEFSLYVGVLPMWW